MRFINAHAVSRTCVDLSELTADWALRLAASALQGVARINERLGSTWKRTSGMFVFASLMGQPEAGGDIGNMVLTDITDASRPSGAASGPLVSSVAYTRV